MKNSIKKLLVASATSFELAPFMDFLEKEAIKKSFFTYEYNGISIYPMVTGVGPTFTAFALSRFSDIKNIDFTINIGIAGAFKRDINIGDTFQVDRDCFGDLGVEEADGQVSDVFDLELMKSNDFPFSQKWMINDTKRKMESHLPLASCLTVNCVSGTNPTIELRKNKYNADLESMEGGAFAYACKMMQMDYLQLRAVSNHVEVRNKENWNIELAIQNVNAELIRLVKTYHQVS